MRYFLPLLLLAIYGQAAQAADQADELDLYQNLPTVLSASRLVQPLSEAPNAMTVIDRKMITASGFRNIPDLFKLVPGMYVGYYKGAQSFVSYHGSTDQYARRMQVMIDGRSVYLPPNGMVEWADLPITVDDIERIEVIRGPAAASHGANSTQGVISIVTRDAGSSDGKQVSLTRGSKGINDVAARFGKRGEKLDYRMTVAYTADNGYDNLTEPPNNMTVSQAQGQTDNSYDNNQSRLLNYRADYHPNGIDSFDIQFGYNHNIKNVGWNDSNSNPVHDLVSNGDFMQLGWLRVLEDSAELSLRYSHIRHDQHEAFPIRINNTFYPGPYLQFVNTRRDEIELQHTLAATPDNRLVYGAAWRRDQLEGQRHDIPPLAPAFASASDTDEWRVFAHDEWRITPDLLLNTGGMYERDGLGHRNLSPRIAFNFHILPEHTLRLGSSVAYRTPSLMEERFPAIQPGELFVISTTENPAGLKPEKLVSREIGYLGKFSDWNSTLDMRVFSDLLRNGIFWGQSSFVNGLDAEYRGIETTFKHSFNKSSELAFNFAHELARSNAPSLAAAGYGYLSSSAPNTNDILSGSTPKNSGSLAYSRSLDSGYSFSAAYYYQSAMQPFDRGPVDYQPIQRRTDVRVAKTLRDLGGIKADLALVIQNLFDQGYTDYVSTNLFNRRGYVMLTVNW
jgi:iron complex outermembrane receptor protein